MERKELGTAGGASLWVLVGDRMIGRVVGGEPINVSAPADACDLQSYWQHTVEQLLKAQT